VEFLTYIPMSRGFVYLAVMLDWFSRPRHVVARTPSLPAPSKRCRDRVVDARQRYASTRSCRDHQCTCPPSRSVSAGPPPR
jgi:hypothetical protein